MKGIRLFAQSQEWWMLLMTENILIVFPQNSDSNVMEYWNQAEMNVDKVWVHYFHLIKQYQPIADKIDRGSRASTYALTAIISSLSLIVVQTQGAGWNITLFSSIA